MNRRYFSNYFNETFFFKQKPKKGASLRLWTEKVTRINNRKISNKQFNDKWHG